MEKYILLFILFFHHVSMIAQNTFFKWYSTETYEYVYECIESDDGQFILSGLLRNPDRTGPSQAYLLKIDYLGNKVNEYIQPIAGDTTTSCCTIFKPYGDIERYQVIYNKFFGELSGNQHHKTVFMQLSENLDLIHQSEITSPNNYFYLPQYHILSSDNTLYLQSTVCALSPFFK